MAGERFEPGRKAERAILAGDTAKGLHYLRAGLSRRRARQGRGGEDMTDLSALAHAVMLLTRAKAPPCPGEGSQ